MPRLNIALAALFAPVALAVPKAQGYGYGGYGHGYGHTHKHPAPSGISSAPIPSGTGESPIGGSTAPYGFGNSTGINGPTGTGTGIIGTGSSTLPLHTVTVLPVPVSSGGSGSSPAGTSDLGNSPTGGSSAGECGPATVTVTSANTITVTVPATSAQESSPYSASSVQTAPYPIGNSTTGSGPTGSGTGYGTSFPVPSATSLPVVSSVPASTESPVETSTNSPVEASSAPAYTPVSTPASEAPVSSPSQVAPETTPTSAQYSAPYVPASSASVPGAGFYSKASSSPSTTTPVVATIPESSPASTPTSSPSTTTPVVATTPESSPASTLTSSPSTSGGDVVPRGLVYNTASLTDLFKGNNVGWCYNWDSQPGGTVPSSFNYVPMLWSTSNLHLPNWKSNVETAISNGATHILGFNEPDLTAQANMAPQDAADAWTNMEQFGGKVKIGSPAVCNGGGATGLNWLSSFMDKCSSCQIDFIAIHWYGLATSDGVADLKKHIGDTQKIAGGRPIWLTEFQPSGSTADQQNFMSQMLPWLDDASNGVERYAYYQVDGILASGNSLTTLGDAYAS